LLQQHEKGKQIQIFGQSEAEASNQSTANEVEMPIELESFFSKWKCKFLTAKNHF